MYRARYILAATARVLISSIYRDSQIADQVSVLNKDFASTGLSYALVNTTRIVNSDWFVNVGPDSPLQTTMKNALRQGGAADLNVYTVGCVDGNILLESQLITPPKLPIRCR